MAEGVPLTSAAMGPHKFMPSIEFPRSCVKCGRVAEAKIHVVAARRIGPRRFEQMVKDAVRR